jgi:glycosyltransferase involved in cell wall biosynthesis
LMKHASIFAFPTYYEGLPNALIEAMICGAVPVSSDCPTGPREIIAPDTQLTTQAQNYEVSPNGILIAPFDANNPDKANGVQAWTDALNYLLDHPSLVANIQSHLPSRWPNTI